MKDFRKSSSKPEPQGQPMQTRLRTDFRCVAHGCPNAGAIDDHGEGNRGKCYYHWSSSPDEWAAITQRIRFNDEMKNHGIVPTKQSTWVKQVLAEIRGPRGMRSARSDGQETTMYAKDAA